MKWMIPWQNTIVAIILALGIATSLILLSANEFTHNGHISGEEATTISTVLGAGIGSIATYLGVKHGGKEDE